MAKVGKCKVCGANRILKVDDHCKRCKMVKNKSKKE